jgi:uncharacterized protein
MILLDVNLLLYAVDADSPMNAKAKAWLERVMAGPETVAFPWITLLAFLRLTTKPRLFERPLSVEEAIEVAGRWLNQSAALVVHPGPRHMQILAGLLRPVGTGGNLTSDAHLAALAIEHGAVLCSCDNDFARFQGLKWHNPLGS